MLRRNPSPKSNSTRNADHPWAGGGGSSGFLVEGVLTVLRLKAPYRAHPRDWPMNFRDTRNNAVGLIPAKLRVTLAGADTVVSWPAQPDPAVLQASDDLKLADWNPVQTAVTTGNGQNIVTLQAGESHRWYRL